MSFQKRNFWIVFGIATFAVAVVVMSTTLIVGSLLSAESPEPAVTKPLEYDLGAKAAYLKIVSPRPGETLQSPLTISGSARLWYFEGSFPVELKDANGAVLASGAAQARGDWMTDAFVPFTVTLVFDRPTTLNGTLVFKKDNPSGLPQNDDSVSVPVSFGSTVGSAPAVLPSAPVLGDCRPGGCSGELCTDQDAVSACLYRAEFACYQSATCARQADGQCGWTMTPELQACLDGSRATPLYQ